jgi:hypothetical protein
LAMHLQAQQETKSLLTSGQCSVIQDLNVLLACMIPPPNPIPPQTANPSSNLWLSERKSACSERIIKLSSVSPTLAGMRDTDIPMPAMAGGATPLEAALQHTGVHQITASASTISALGGEIELLRTRTRPKKISLLASDGRRCTFLLKVDCSKSRCITPAYS